MTPRRIGGGSLAIGLGAYVLAVERWLFEIDPARWGWLGRAGPALLGAVLIAGIAAMMWRRAGARRPSPVVALALLLPLAGWLGPGVDHLRSATLVLGSGLMAGILTAFETETAHRSSWLPATLGAAVFLLYLRTLAPTVGEADTFEFQVAVARLAVAHPTGYPLFILIGKLFSLLPVGGSLAYRVNLASATFGVVSALLAYALAGRLGAGPIAAGLAGLLAGISPTLWSRAVEAEVYTLHAALVAAGLLACLRFVQPAERRQAARWLALIGLTFGLGLGNHLTIILLAPAIGLSVLLALGRHGWRPFDLAPRSAWAWALGAFALGVSVIAYIPLRWPAVNHGELMSWGMFWDYVTGREPQGALHLNAFLTDASRYAVLARKVVAEFGPAGALLAAIGLGWTIRRKPAAAALTLTAYLALMFFPLSFYVPDPDFSAFLIAPHLIQAVWIGLGMHVLAVLAAGLLQRAIGRGGLEVSLTGLFLLLPLSLIWTTLPRVDQSDDWDMHQLGQYALSQPIQPNALVLADSQKFPALYYLQVAEGMRPDLDIRVLPDEATYRADLDDALAIGRPVYLGRYLPGLAGLVHMRSVGPLIEVSGTRFPDPPVPPNKLDVVFGDVIRLLGLDAVPVSVSAGESVDVTLHWQATGPVEGNYLVRFRLLDDAGTPAWEGPGRAPVGGMNPTSAWTPGETIPDFQTVDLDPALTPGMYTLQAGLYPPFSDAGLRVQSGSTWADLFTLSVSAPMRPAVPARQARAYFANGLWLVGMDLPESIAPGARVPITLYWLAVDPPAPATVELIGAAEQTIASLDIRKWPAGTWVPVRYSLQAPESGSTLSLSLRLAGSTVRCGWLAPVSGDCSLPPIKIEGAAVQPGAINFADTILMESLRVETDSAVPGGTVDVAIRWRGLQAMNEDYTVFVHLIGPDGLVHGQVDSWPVSGTLATSTWATGQLVDDRYTIQVPADAPPGHYQVEVGWYLLQTLERLPVLGSDGIPIDDRVVAPGPSIQ